MAADRRSAATCSRCGDPIWGASYEGRHANVLICEEVERRSAAYMRCPSMNPKSTRPDDQCQRPLGHTGDHFGTAHSGGVVIYPSKWEDETDADA